MPFRPPTEQRSARAAKRVGSRQYPDYSGSWVQKAKLHPGRLGDQYRLTTREVEVILAAAECGFYKCAAACLGISVQTIKNHIYSILQKTEAESLTQALWVLWVADAAESEGLIDG